MIEMSKYMTDGRIYFVPPSKCLSMLCVCVCVLNVARRYQEMLSQKRLVFCLLVNTEFPIDKI